jgi:Sulfotransferase family/Aspartyl/Asparaginyl beta-hydroxylase
MHLPHRFYKFPFRFDTERLKAELFAVPEGAWRHHPQDFSGNSALPLISTNGDVDDNGFEAPMTPTEYLKASPYIQQILGEFRTLLGRARFMRLEPGFGVPAHFDVQYYWRTHTRVHIPIVSDPAIRFHCESESVHMAEGEAWTFDNWRMHEVVNETPVRRVHLTFDTFGSTDFWELAQPLGQERPARFIPFQKGAQPKLMFETFAGEPAMQPAELDLELWQLMADVAAYPGNDPAGIAHVRALTDSIRKEWRTVWYLYGPTAKGLQGLAALSSWAKNAVTSVSKNLLLASNGRPLATVLTATFGAMIKPTAQFRVGGAAGRAVPRFDKPVFIVAAPRSGSTLVFESLAANEAFWTLGGEGHQHVERIEALKMRTRDFSSNRLVASDVTPDISQELLANYLVSLRNAKGELFTDAEPAPKSVRFLEKTPKNALRIPFFKAIFPDAKFIFLHREPRANMSAIIEAWRSGRFVTYRDLPGWSGPPWSLLLIPGWRELSGRDPGEIAMRQWRDTNRTILDDLAALPAGDWCAVSYEEFLADPAGELQRLCTFAGVAYSDAMRTIAARPLKPSRYTLTPPDPQKWRKNETLIAPHLAATEAVFEKLSQLGAETKAAERV